MDEFSVHPNETSSADEAQLDTLVPERLSIKAPDLRPVNIVPGQMDQAGRHISDVYWISKHYAIYRWRKCTDEKSFLRMAKRNSFTYGIAVQLCDDNEHNASYAQIGPDLAQIAALQKGSLSTRCSVNCEIARCIALTLEGHIDAAKPILVTLRRRLQAMRDTEDRASYSVILTLVVTVAILLCWALKVYLPNGPTLFPQVPLVLLFGALGGYFSVLTKINRLGLDPEASRAIMAVSAITRILVAMVGAFAVYTFLMSTFGKSLVNTEMLVDKEFATVAIFAFLAGFSENFVPGIFNALEQRSARQTVDASAVQQTSSDLPLPAQRLVRKI